LQDIKTNNKIVPGMMLNRQLLWNDLYKPDYYYCFRNCWYDL